MTVTLSAANSLYGVEFTPKVIRGLEKHLRTFPEFSTLKWNKVGPDSPTPQVVYSEGRQGLGGRPFQIKTSDGQIVTARELYVDIGIGKLAGVPGVHVFTRNRNDRQDLTFFNVSHQGNGQVGGVISSIVYSYDGQQAGKFVVIDGINIQTQDFYKDAKSFKQNFLLDSVLGGTNILLGSSFSDELDAGDGDDQIIGGGGSDKLRGGMGRDQFIFKSLSDSGIGVKGRDLITDFSGSRGDKISLSEIDANPTISGVQSFNFIGSKGFSGSGGEVRFSGEILQVNIDSDKIPDMEIALNGVMRLDPASLML
jgi:Ca2+-binding RTX toxin-like protein